MKLIGFTNRIGSSTKHNTSITVFADSAAYAESAAHVKLVTGRSKAVAISCSGRRARDNSREVSPRHFEDV